MRKSLTLLVTLMLVLGMTVVSIPAMADDVPTLTVFVEEVVTIEDWETNEATKWMEEQLGCNLDFVIAPVGSGDEKMNVLLNSGDYPDIFYRNVPNENLYGIEAGMILELTDYIKPEIMPNFCEQLELYPDVLKQIKAVDGGVYAFPRMSECTHCMYSRKMFYNKALMDSLGRECPKTIDEFYETLVAFKAAYPDGIGLTGCGDIWQFLCNAWTYISDEEDAGLRLKDDVVDSYFVSDGYREGLAFVRKLYAEDMLYEGSFTMDGTQMKALLASETPVLFWTAGNNVSYVDGAATPELYANEKPVEPLVGPNGAQYTTYTAPAPIAALAISSKCEHVDLAVKFADIHYSLEGYWRTNEGVLGEQWDYNEEGTLSVLGEPSRASRLGAYISDLQNVKWEPRALNWQTNAFAAGKFDPATYDETLPSCGANFRSLMTVELYAPHNLGEYDVLSVKFSGEEEEELSMRMISLKNYIAESRVAFITGSKDLDSDWDAYLNSLKSMGLNEVIGLYQTAYDRVK